MSTDQPLEIGGQIEATATPEGDGTLAQSMLALSDSAWSDSRNRWSMGACSACSASIDARTAAFW